MNSSLVLRNRHRAKKIDSPYLRQIVRALLRTELKCRDYDLAIHLVGSETISEINQAWLGHTGPTDVITFDYSHPPQTDRFAGELLVCVPVAEAQARRFHTTWQSEVVRYIVHGLLHLGGYDDQAAGDRRRMKREENRLLKRLDAAFNLDRVGDHRKRR